MKTIKTAGWLNKTLVNVKLGESNFRCTVDLNGEEVDATARMKFYEGEPQTWDYPGSPDSAEILTIVRDDTGEDIREQLTDNEYDRIVEDFMNNHYGMLESNKETYYEHKRNGF